MSTPLSTPMPQGPRAIARLPPDESQLAARAAAGDEEAAARLVEASYRPVYAALFRLTGGDADLAADLTQETFRQAWAALSGFRGGAAFSTWLYRIAYNTWASHLRRPRPVAASDALPEPPATGPGPADEAIGRDQARRLRHAVLALPDALRFTVTARYWRDLSVAEIAQLEGITTVAVRKRLTKAFGLVRRHLEDS